MIRAYTAAGPGEPLELQSYDPGPPAADEVEIAVESCGVCHSDLSMLDNDWGMTSYPFVPGHEVVGRVAAVGDGVTRVAVGDTVGLGWFAGSCMACEQCMGGDHNLCAANEGTIIGRHGGFADRVRCREAWAIPLPADLDATKAGPLFCGGITVFNPIVEFGVRPIDHVGVIGIGGLGHFALQFLAKWGCEVTAFTSTGAKTEQALELGAHRVVDSRDPAALDGVAGTLDFILSTVNADLDWDRYLAALRPKGRLHSVGAVPSPIPAPAFTLLAGQKSVSGSPLGSPATTAHMLEFCARHGIEAVTQHYPLSRVNEALDHLRAGEARYRIVLENDLD